MPTTGEMLIAAGLFLLASSDPPTWGERSLFGIWVWGRCLVLCTLSAGLAYVTWDATMKARTFSDMGVAFVVGLLAFLAGWVGWFGGGRSRSLADDRRIHAARRRRYRRR